VTDREQAAQAYETFMDAIGVPTDTAHTADTPARVVDSRVDELFAGLQTDPRDHLRQTFADDAALTDQFVIVDNIRVESTCAHHFLPFRGYAHVGYIPSGAVVGLSKLARVVDGYARRPQVQERLTNQIADAIEDCLSPTAVVVYVRADHLCMACRGVEEQASSTRTTALRGKAREAPHIKQEFFDALDVACAMD
jgi:GTP cyclohydrolase I